MWLNVLLMVLAGVTDNVGDVFLRKAADAGSFNWMALLGAFCCAMEGVFLYRVYKTHNFITIACTYAPLSAVLFALLGVWFFGDQFTWKSGLALAFSLAAITLVSLD